MRNYISLLSTACYAADNGNGTVTADNGVTLAASAAPRVLADLSQASTLAAEIAADKATAKASGGKGKAKAKAKAKALPVADLSEYMSKGSKVDAFRLPLHKLLLTGPKRIDVLAQKLVGGTERKHTDFVRSIIDNMRKVISPANPSQGKFKLANTARFTFGYVPGFKLTESMLKAIGGK